MDYKFMKKNYSGERSRTIFFGIFILIFAFGLANTSPVWAQYGGQRFITQAQKLENRASSSAAHESLSLQNIISRATNMISKRVASLNNLISRINSDSKLSSDEKTSLVSDVNAEITTLNTLQTKISSDTDVTTARNDAKTIVTNNHIYLVFEPKYRILVVIDNLQTLSGKVSSLSGQVQTTIDSLKLQGKDTTNLQNLLNDVNSQLSTINSHLSSDKSSIEAVTLTDATGAHSVFVTVRQDLAQNVRANFAKIRSDFAQMREDLHIVFGQGTASPKPTEGSSESAH